MNKSTEKYLKFLSKKTKERNEIIQPILDTGQLDRGLEDNINHPRYFGYKTGLNTDFESYISNQITSENSQIGVLDVGAGRGAFLGDLERKFGKNVSCFGISVHNFENVLFTKNHYIVGDAFNNGKDYILDKIPSESMDIVTSQFVSHPKDFSILLNYFNNVGRILVPGGISRHLDGFWNDKFLNQMVKPLKNSGIEMNCEYISKMRDCKYVGGNIISLSKKF